MSKGVASRRAWGCPLASPAIPKCSVCGAARTSGMLNLQGLGAYACNCSQPPRQIKTRKIIVLSNPLFVLSSLNNLLKIKRILKFLGRSAPSENKQKQRENLKKQQQTPPAKFCGRRRADNPHQCPVLLLFFFQNFLEEGLPLNQPNHEFMVRVESGPGPKKSRGKPRGCRKQADGLWHCPMRAAPAPPPFRTAGGFTYLDILPSLKEGDSYRAQAARAWVASAGSCC